MGYIYALLSSLFFTLYALPKKKTKIKPYLYVFFMGISCLIASIIFYLIFGLQENLFDKWLIISFLGGMIWFIASALFFYSIDKIGVARASEFKSMQGPIGSILILIILKEFTSLNIYLLLLAIIFIFLSALMLVVKDEKNKKIKIVNILIALLSALLYGLNGFVRKVVTIHGFVYSQQIYSALGIITLSLLFIFIREKKLTLNKENKNDYLYPLLSGVFYYFASFFMLISYKKIEGSIAFTIIQLNAIFTTLIGIFIFKEINYKKYYKRLLLGLLFMLMGISLLIIC